MAALDYKKLSFEEVKDWCKKNNQVEWLKGYVKEYEAEKGKKPTFFSIKKAFATKFMPEILPKKSKPTIYDDIENL